MSFENAPVSKGFMAGIALTSFLVGLFDAKHYFSIQLVPHISKHHQYWRLFSHSLAFTNSSDLFIAEVLMYNVGIQIERYFGSVKFASFAIVSVLLSIILEFISLLLFSRLGFNYISCGPSPLLFSILHQYSRVVPTVYHLRIFGVPLSNKSFTYLLALQFAVGNLPASGVLAVIGLLTGQAYRSELFNLKTYRVSPSVVHLSRRLLLPVLGSMRGPRRTTRAFPDRSTPLSTNVSGQGDDEVVTTARPLPSGTSSVTSRARTATSSTDTVREWVNELTGRNERANVAIRVPSQAEISQVTTMFPDIPRETLVATLQRSPNVEAAVETLLSSQR